MSAVFGSDRVLLYDVDPWNRPELAFGCPNFGDNVGTQSVPIARLVDEIGKAQLFIMTHVDATRTKPPSPNTVQRLGKLTMRVQSVLLGRKKSYTGPQQLRLEEQHVRPAPKIFQIHPVPYFPSRVMRNPWLQEYNELCMFGLANMMQHSDNDLALTVTEAFTKDVWQYFFEIKKLVASELLRLPPEKYLDENYQFTTEDYEQYDPEAVIVNMEALDTPGPVFNLPTEDDLKQHFIGYPANIIAPLLKQYPVTSMADLSGTLPTSGVGAVLSQTAQGPAVIGPPQI